MGLALQYAKDGIRVNAVMPGLMNTPLIYQQISGQYANAEEMVRARDAVCPMGRMGTAWGHRPCGSFSRVRSGGIHHGRESAGRWRLDMPNFRLSIAGYKRAM
jgi:NAD(P)-dependent dehydrogenase (short-subunit alcohol dehydrogenase family)